APQPGVGTSKAGPLPAIRYHSERPSFVSYRFGPFERSVLRFIISTLCLPVPLLPEAETSLPTNNDRNFDRAAIGFLVDHPVRADDNRLRHLAPKRSRGSHVDYKLKFRGLLDR